MEKKNFFITTTLPYVNAPLHLGHATEIIRADAIARYKELAGFNVFSNTGTDEHGMKISEAAAKMGKDPQSFVDEYASLFKTTVAKFGISENTHYIRTTDEKHIKAAQEFWKRCNQNGFIYKKNYQTKYCVGCEEEKTDSQLVDGKCPVHNRVPETIDEENYFFKLSDFEEKLLDLYNKNPNFTIPSNRVNELVEFVKSGLRDFSISRRKEKMAWGIPVPGDDEHVMYVWFDALVNYVSTLGWPDDTKNFEDFWVNGTPTQYCGKDNTRFQGLMWQAMLMAADLPSTQNIVVDGFILGDGGVKMSKTLGNVIDPLELQAEYGTDALRYFILREFHPFEDTAVSKENLKELYNAHLANGIGNLTSRIMKMVTTYDVSLTDDEKKMYYYSENMKDDNLEKFDVKVAMDEIWFLIQSLDGDIQRNEPYKKIKVNPDEAKKELKTMLRHLLHIGIRLEPFLPCTSIRIRELITENKMPLEPLFVRKV